MYHSRYDLDNWDTIIYIDGVRRRATHLGTPMFVDSDDLPCRRCAQHSLNAISVHHLQQGGRVHTSGHWYSLSPDKE